MNQEKPLQPLTINQHVLPVASIERFYGPKAKSIEMEWLETGKRFPLKAKHENFGTERAWTQPVEEGATKIETAFQIAVEEFSASGTLSTEHMRIASAFYALIQARSVAKHYRVPAAENPIDFSDQLPLGADEAIRFERDGIFFPSDEADLDRLVKSISIIANTNATIRRQEQWSLLVSEGPEFLVSDDYSTLTLIPVRPHMYLSKNDDRTILNVYEVQRLNEKIRASAKDYCFARCFKACEST